MAQDFRGQGSRWEVARDGCRNVAMVEVNFSGMMLLGVFEASRSLTRDIQCVVVVSGEACILRYVQSMQVAMYLVIAKSALR